MYSVVIQGKLVSILQNIYFRFRRFLTVCRLGTPQNPSVKLSPKKLSLCRLPRHLHTKHSTSASRASIFADLFLSLRNAITGVLCFSILRVKESKDIQNGT